MNRIQMDRSGIKWIELDSEVDLNGLTALNWIELD